MADLDYAIALSLEEEISTVKSDEIPISGTKRKMANSIVDDCWETIDPTPDIRELFMQFNDLYFYGKLSCCEVKWAPRMTLCAGVCCYEGRGGLCSIKLSMPLLKLRPRKDLVETLLHEMIHAYLFVTHNNKDREGHGPEFHKHMRRINRASGANITVYHNFHDEVQLYRKHWWRCDGPCQKRPPYYGMVCRAMNRAPSANDPWWSDHQRTCGGTYHKVKEPEDYGKKKRKTKSDISSPSKNKVTAVKGVPKIYDLWNDESRKKAGKFDENSGNTSLNAAKIQGKTNTQHGEHLTDNSKKVGDINNCSTSNVSTRISSTNGGISSSDNKARLSGVWKNDEDDTSNNDCKENDTRKINISVTPFTGEGRVLGGTYRDSKPSIPTCSRLVKEKVNTGRNLGNSSLPASHTNNKSGRRFETNTLTNTKKLHKEPAGNVITTSFSSAFSYFVRDHDGRANLNNGQTVITTVDQKTCKDDSIGNKTCCIDIKESDFDFDNVKNTVGVANTKHESSKNFTTGSTSFTVLTKSDGLTNRVSQSETRPETQLTILDAFKKVGDKKVAVVVLDSTPTKAETLTFVKCPVCAIKVIESGINMHLDSCLSLLEYV